MSVLGLTSYYRRYIEHFANIAAPLYSLTQAGEAFMLNKDCSETFDKLKRLSTEAPVLVYPAFDPKAYEFDLQTDASAVWEQDGHPIAYTS